MNLESQKVVESNLKLDSKTRQKSNKELETKLPKIQRVKNTYDSITIQNPTNSQKSKESSKVKTLIRTIPVSITLAMALSSQMAVADITAQAGGEIQIPDNVGTIINAGTTIINDQIMQGTTTSGSNGTIVNATIVNGTIVNGTSSVKTTGVTASNNQGTIINGWNFRDGAAGTSVNGGIVIGSNFGGSKSMPISVLIGKAGDLLIDDGVVLTVGGNNNAVANGVVFVGQNAQAGTITNKGTITGGNKNIAVANNGIAAAIINEGVINVENFQSDNFGIMAWGGTNIQTIINKGTISGEASASRGLIGLSGSTVGTLLLDGGVLRHADGSSGQAILIYGSSNVDNFTITNGASITGNTDIKNTSNIGTMVIGGANNSGTTTKIIGNLNLTDRGYIDTLSLNQGTITGGISLTGNADGVGTNTATIGEITLANSSTITGNISVKGDGASTNANAKIGNIILENGTGIGGSIAVGDSNGAANTNGEIAGITLYGNSTIAGGIINNANGNIGTIVSNTNDGVSNTITNSGTIGSLEVNNQGTIVYKSDSGIITDTLSVASGAWCYFGY